jgi:dihydrodipicolinate synthase/N-acetylneuraminate lyase
VSAQRISGTVSAAVTPLRDDGRRIDEDAVAPLLQFYRDGGVDGVLAMGTTGEGVLLGPDERRRVAELVLGGADGLRVIVHCGAQTTAETAALAAHAAESGADGVAVIAPPYFAFAPDEVLEHLAAAAAACAPVPFYVYEFAARSGYVVSVSVVEQLRERASNLVGMKVSDAPFDRVEPYLSIGLDVFIGAEALVREGLARGAVGAVSGVAAAFPDLVAALVHEPTAERSTLLASLRGVLSEHPFQASIKAALAMRGVPVRPDVRAPLLPLQPEAIEHLRGELERLLGEDALASARPLSRPSAGA